MFKTCLSVGTGSAQGCEPKTVTPDHYACSVRPPTMYEGKCAGTDHPPMCFRWSASLSDKKLQDTSRYRRYHTCFLNFSPRLFARSMGALRCPLPEKCDGNFSKSRTSSPGIPGGLRQRGWRLGSVAATAKEVRDQLWQAFDHLLCLMQLGKARGATSS